MCGLTMFSAVEAAMEVNGEQRGPDGMTYCHRDAEPRTGELRCFQFPTRRRWYRLLNVVTIIRQPSQSTGRRPFARTHPKAALTM